jgi:hypothetical protein
MADEAEAVPRLHLPNGPLPLDWASANRTAEEVGIHLGAAIRDASGLDPNLARARDLRAAFYVGICGGLGLNLTSEWIPPPPLNWACPTCAARNALDLFLCACGQRRGLAHSLLLHPPKAPAVTVSPSGPSGSSGEPQAAPPAFDRLWCRRRVAEGRTGGAEVNFMPTCTCGAVLSKCPNCGRGISGGSELMERVDRFPLALGRNPGQPVAKSLGEPGALEKWAKKTTTRGPPQARLVRAQARLKLAEQELLLAAQEANVFGGDTPRSLSRP